MNRETILPMGKLPFKRKLPTDLAEALGRELMNKWVVTSAIRIWNTGGNVDEYLMNSEDCSQDEREIIMQGLHEFQES